MTRKGNSMDSQVLMIECANCERRRPSVNLPFDHRHAWLNPRYCEECYYEFLAEGESRVYNLTPHQIILVAPNGETIELPPCPIPLRMRIRASEELTFYPVYYSGHMLPVYFPKEIVTYSFENLPFWEDLRRGSILIVEPELFAMVINEVSYEVEVYTFAEEPSDGVVRISALITRVDD